MKHALPVLSLVVVAALGGCQAPANPAKPSVPSCQANNTSEVKFENRSNSNKTYTIVWDGSSLTTLAPTQASQAYTVAAGVSHSLQFKITNTSSLACTTSHPTPTQCGSHTYWCTY